MFILKTIRTRNPGQISALRFQRDVLVDGLNAGLINRAEALRLIVETVIQTRPFNRAFVLMEYFGYLRRNPDDPPDNNLDGYNFWLNSSTSSTETSSVPTWSKLSSSQLSIAALRAAVIRRQVA